VNSNKTESAKRKTIAQNLKLKEYLLNEKKELLNILVSCILTPKGGANKF